MTHVLRVKNVNHAFKEAWWWMRVAGVREASRNGPVLVAPGMFITEYSRPWERVLFSPKRDANPIFHLMEAIWMIAGEDNVSWLSQFSSNISTYAELDGTMHGAYGHRWRTRWGDQLTDVIEVLEKDPNTRQAVLEMWDYRSDLRASKKDKPCNTHIYFDCRGGALNMTVCCRSNDMLWGAYGANAVHFSFLQELMASTLKFDIGTYRQVSNNFHLYTDNEMVKDFLANPPHEPYDEYQEGICGVPLLLEYESFKDFSEDCLHCVHGSKVMITEFMKMAVKLRDCYLMRKEGKDYRALLDKIPPCDWKVAFIKWTERRRK